MHELLTMSEARGMPPVDGYSDLHHETLDELLCRWHQYGGGLQLVRGHAKRSLVVGEYVGTLSGLYDDDTGHTEAKLEWLQMKEITRQVDEMPDPYRVAIYVVARDLVVGVSTFMSPRLPGDRLARMQIVSTARDMAIRRFLAAGLM